jgi:exosome complex RNA-binding protein Csl4
MSHWLFLKKKISLGDARSYFVTTARNDLGVIFATSEAGNNSNLISRDI